MSEGRKYWRDGDAYFVTFPADTVSKDASIGDMWAAERYIATQIMMERAYGKLVGTPDIHLTAVFNNGCRIVIYNEHPILLEDELNEVLEKVHNVLGTIIECYFDKGDPYERFGGHAEFLRKEYNTSMGLDKHEEGSTFELKCIKCSKHFPIKKITHIRVRKKSSSKLCITCPDCNTQTEIEYSVFLP